MDFYLDYKLIDVIAGALKIVNVFQKIGSPLGNYLGIVWSKNELYEQDLAHS